MRFVPVPGFWGGPPKRKDYRTHEQYMDAESIYSEIVNNASLSDRAEWYARVAHKGQLRKDGQPYVTHTCRVAMSISLDGRMMEKHVAAGHLHDVVEDTGITLDMIGEVFGMEIAELVDWMTNKSKGMNLSRDERKRIDRERLAKAPDAVKIMKLYDRLDNISDMSGYSDSFKRRYARETLDLVEVLRMADHALAERVADRAKMVLESASRMPVLGKPGLFVHFRHLNEERVRKNHSQDLVSLAERGGLALEEILWVVNDLDILAHDIGDDEALVELRKRGVIEQD